MRVVTERKLVGCLVLLLLGGAACDRAPLDWTPVLEETSTEFLRSEIDHLEHRIRAARSALEAEPARAANELVAAEDSLDHLRTYYLPLLEARELAYNAVRHLHLGLETQTAAELDRVETLLLEVAGSGHGHLVREMEAPLEAVEDARAALSADSSELSRALEELARRLNFMLLRGDLILDD